MRRWEAAGSQEHIYGGTLRGFQIAGPDGNYVEATATLDGSTVVVRSATVTDPRALRYAWDYNPDANLVNSLGLPASLFRTRVDN